MPAAYPLDTTGFSPGNLIPNEVHTLTEVNGAPYRILIPVCAPFYLDNFILKHRDTAGNETVLVQDVHYYHCLPYIGASRSIGKLIYGGVAINDNLLGGTILVTYQTLGGDWVADPIFVRERLIELIYNPKITIWDVVTNKPNQFPPINHSLNIDAVFGQQDLIAGLDRIVTQLAASEPRPTNKILVGLSNVENLPLASQVEIDNLILANSYVTLAQVIPIIRRLIANPSAGL